MLGAGLIGPAVAHLLRHSGTLAPDGLWAIWRLKQDVVWHDAVRNAVVIPVLRRIRVAAVATKLRGMNLSAWDSDFWNLAYWYREA